MLYIGIKLVNIDYSLLMLIEIIITSLKSTKKENKWFKS